MPALEPMPWLKWILGCRRIERFGNRLPCDACAHDSFLNAKLIDVLELHLPGLLVRSVPRQEYEAVATLLRDAEAMSRSIPVNCSAKAIAGH
jgi:hypothetical protein